MIKGELINLRLITEDDLAYIYSVSNDISNKGEFWPTTLETKSSFFNRFTETKFWNDNFGTMVITDKDNKILGEMNYFKGLWYMPGYEIGYRIYCDKDKGKGFASEALKLFIDFIFKSKQINRLEIEVIVSNISSKRVAEKCGFQVEGLKKQAVFLDGKYEDVELLGLVKSDYFK